MEGAGCDTSAAPACDASARTMALASWARWLETCESKGLGGERRR
uniref:Uncharacterized protein n=1 Tax=Arundo donax TaxID=35708 RepID=A0A0A9BH86_ARUDO